MNPLIIIITILILLVGAYLIRKAFNNGYNQGKNDGVREGMFIAYKHVDEEEEYNNRKE
jgi:hypothetical protein